MIRSLQEAFGMRAAILFVIVPTLASAAGWTDIHGENSQGEKVIFRHVRSVTIQKQGDQEAYAQHVRADIIVVKGNGKRIFDNQDCLHSYQASGDAWLSCSPDGASPLAGTTYHQSPPKEGTLSPWICVRSCNASSPPIMKQEPWE